MRRLVYKTLEEKFIPIILTPTALEAHFNPPKFYSTKDKEEEYYEFGDAVHEAVTSILQNPENIDDVMWYYGMSLKRDQIERLYKILQECHNLPPIVLSGAKMRIAIEFGKYLVIYIGKFDVLFKRGEDYGVAEIKTAAHALSREELENRVQLLSYKWLSWVDNVEWWIFTKDWNPALQIYDDIFVPANVEEVMVSKIKTYLEQKYGYDENSD